MPQMNPTWWLTLFLLFLVSFIIVNAINYFLIYNDLIKSTFHQSKNKKIIWKW